MDKKRLGQGAASLLMALLTIGAASPGPTRQGADLQVQLSGLRSGKGTVFLCLSGNPGTYLKCQADPTSVSRAIPAAAAGRLDLGSVKAGTYALLVVHDENRNGKLDMMFGIPREGFGFSNNPAMKPRAPKWEEIRFSVPAAPSVQQVRMRYVL